MKAYLESNTVVCRRGGAPVSSPWQIIILIISVIGHLHMQETTEKTRQYSKCSVHKLNRRLTEAALIYFANV